MPYQGIKAISRRRGKCRIKVGEVEVEIGQGRPSTSGEHESEYQDVQLVDQLGFALAHDPAHGAGVHEGLEHNAHQGCLFLGLGDSGGVHVVGDGTA